MSSMPGMAAGAQTPMMMAFRLTRVLPAGCPLVSSGATRAGAVLG
jgi:hypothetical protein